MLRLDHEKAFAEGNARDGDSRQAGRLVKNSQDEEQKSSRCTLAFLTAAIAKAFH